jgi:hypothetical protein
LGSPASGARAAVSSACRRTPRAPISALRARCAYLWGEGASW